ncbi:hypothetical protein LZ575_03975 [Antarcticibacterium sp. 1MA-6-2]|uniref:hypothetical protein n=1 Tax=Antarcticibacterium sp. 1MA-6-2 TaxID=2908210 RepID=UPI001F3B3368|nr:hypothetical protein [Antarcticibacterium sp. 1MA-6-2]UJH91827.1 hypothetical protein LZ575_03975 [Antarcticibacterium sp. 1MA-6-2]
MINLKKKLLVKGLIYDAIGMATYAVPLVGPFLDLLWAPYAAKKMRQMYSGNKGKVASVLVFLEEILPGTDVIPTFTLMWLYTFVWKKETANEIVLEAEVI